ncbi:site-specific integrase [Rhodococcoides fascians]|uniref:site-specific integrase n=1 Tax=Rhodococcoides fascians TaxID=1828 RepID=UPI000691BD01|nr:site-specific integrase [Rhodococcus fascians]
MPRPPLPIGAHGKITRKQLPDGRWQAFCRVRDADGVTRPILRYTPTGAADRTGAAAERALVEALSERTVVASDVITPASKVSVLWTAFRKQLVEKDRAPLTFESYDPVGKRIVTALGNLQIREATTQRIDAFVAEIVTRSGVSTAKIARTILTGMFKIAVRFGACTVNPVREIEVKASKRKARPKSMDPAVLADVLTAVRESTVPCPVILSPYQIRKGLKTTTHQRVPTVAEFCEHADLADVVTMFAATGVRISELMGLRWAEDIDLGKRRIRVAGKVVRLVGTGLEWQGFPKSEAGERELPLPQFAVDMLSERPQNGAMLFQSSTGTLRDPDTVGRQWRQVRTALGLDWVTSHTFRKTVATIIDEEGLTARVAADQLGHAQISMTQDVYMGRGRVHVEVADALDGVMSKASSNRRLDVKKDQAS